MILDILDVLPKGSEQVRDNYRPEAFECFIKELF